MEIVTFLIFAIIEAVFFGISVWFITYGFRNWNDRRSAAIVLFCIGFLGLYIIVDALMTIGIL